MITGLFHAPTLNIVKTRANFQACENIAVVMETFILKGKLELTVVQHPGQTCFMFLEVCFKKTVVIINFGSLISICTLFLNFMSRLSLVGNLK